MTSYVIYYNDRRIGFKIPEDVYPSSVTQFAVRNVHGFLHRKQLPPNQHKLSSSKQPAQTGNEFLVKGTGYTVYTLNNYRCFLLLLRHKIRFGSDS